MNEDNPTCGKCGITMTPENSKIAPEYFLCDLCAPGQLVMQAVNIEGSQMIGIGRIPQPFESPTPCIVLEDATIIKVRQGWRRFVCHTCGRGWESKTRDHSSLSVETCSKCGDDSQPLRSWADPEVKVDKWGNLEKEPIQPDT